MRRREGCLPWQRSCYLKDVILLTASDGRTTYHITFSTLWLNSKEVTMDCQATQLSYVHTYIHTYTYTYIHTYIILYVYVHTYIHTYMYTYIHTYVHTRIRTYIHTYIYVYVHTYIHIRIRTYMHTYTYTYVYVHTYIHIRTYTYIHTDIRMYVHTHYCSHCCDHVLAMQKLHLSLATCARTSCTTQYHPCDSRLSFHTAHKTHNKMRHRNMLKMGPFQGLSVHN